jgi:small conductance mechanosensitive channel
MNFNEFVAKYSGQLLNNATEIGRRLIGALLVYLIGRWVIGLIEKAVSNRLAARKFDPTMGKYVDSIVKSALNILLILSVLGMLGVETTSFAALLAAAGLAIGAAWGGLLANFAAGAFLIMLKPYKVGDMISAGGVTGDVVELGLFTTTVNTVDNIRITVGNNKIFADNIQNYTVNPHRRVDLKAQLPHGVSTADAIAKLRERVAKIPNVLATPAPSVEIVDFTLAGPVLCVRPFAHNNHYWDVYFATNAAIVEVFTAAGYPVPETHVHLRKAA